MLTDWKERFGELSTAGRELGDSYDLVFEGGPYSGHSMHSPYLPGFEWVGDTWAKYRLIQKDGLPSRDDQGRVRFEYYPRPGERPQSG